jgi:hypothetical protein
MMRGANEDDVLPGWGHAVSVFAHTAHIEKEKRSWLSRLRRMSRFNTPRRSLATR